MNREEKRRFDTPSRYLLSLCLVISLLSLALSAYMIYGFFRVRQTAVEGLDAAIEALDTLSQQGFQYDYPFNQEIPVSADIPIRQLLFPRNMRCGYDPRWVRTGSREQPTDFS